MEGNREPLRHFFVLKKEPLLWNSWEQLAGQAQLPEGITMEQRALWSNGSTNCCSCSQ